MLVAGPFIAGLLVHLFFASVLVEAATGRIPRAFVLVPIIAYGGYYAAYFQEGLQVEQLSQKLRTSNSGKIYDLDPTVNSLVMDQAQEFVETHDVPVVYEPNANFPEAYLSERLITRAQCRGIKKDTENRVVTLGVIFNGIFQENVCFLRGGPGCLNRFSASISGTSARVMLPSGRAAVGSRLDRVSCRQGSNVVSGHCRS
jgi:hypothetical protein